MPTRSLPFDSVSGDRVINAADFARTLLGIIGNGIIEASGGEFAVSESNPPAMSVSVATGRAFIFGYFFEVYDSAVALTIAAADPANPRIDRVVMRRNLSTRTVELAVLTGTPAASPTAPALTQNEAGTYELPLARISVAAAASSIVNANITDERGTRAKSQGLPNVHASEHAPGASDAIATGAPGASAVGDSAAAGTAASVARSDHRHGREAFAAPAVVLGAAPAAGAAATPIRSDATIEAFDATVPVNQAIGDAAAVGAAAKAARRDHRHGMPAFGASQAETAFGGAKADGAATTIARSDHKHGTPAHGSAEHPVGTTVPAGAPGASAVGDSAAAGASTSAARADHRHGREAFGAAQAETSYGTAKADGVAATIARSDHKHGNPAMPTSSDVGAWAKGSGGGGAAGGTIWVGTTEPAAAVNGDVWIKG